MFVEAFKQVLNFGADVSIDPYNEEADQIVVSL